MKQMVNITAPVVRRAKFGTFVGYFFRIGLGDDRIFFAANRGCGDPAIPFPVLEDGSISTTAVLTNMPEGFGYSIVEIVKDEDLGITERRWVDILPE